MAEPNSVNTALAAAAPELLKALKWAMGEIDRLARGRDGSEETLRKYHDARAAIAKATGEEE